MSRLLFVCLALIAMVAVVRGQFLGFGGNVILCWRCEETECNKYFDFTQHNAEQCDGKCWKSYDVVEAKSREDREKQVEAPASRRCFTSDELMKANAIGVNTANGCRDIKMRDKTKHFCFCDGDMCNGSRPSLTSANLLFGLLTAMSVLVAKLF